jgi:hypothetical protein
MRLSSTAVLSFIGVLGVVFGACAVGSNMYLMEHRPVIDGRFSNTDDPHVLCGRVDGPTYCVRISDRDGAVNTAVVTFAVLFLLPTLIGMIVVVTAGKIGGKNLRLDD